MAWRGRFVTVAVLAAMVLPMGCSDPVDEMSRYPYFLKMLEHRWPTARESLASAEPNVSYVAVLLMDMDRAAESMGWNYQRDNREAAIARLKELAAAFRKDLADKVDMKGANVVLLPGKTAKDVAEATERAYARYVEFREMVAE